MFMIQSSHLSIFEVECLCQCQQANEGLFILRTPAVRNIINFSFLTYYHCYPERDKVNWFCL
jgi:hypothetical protein